MVSKYPYGCAINYICDKFGDFQRPFKSSNRTLRSSNAILLEHPTIKSSKTLGDRAFTLVAPVEWNLLPPSIRKAPSLLLFKKLLKTHLFRIAHDTST